MRSYFTERQNRTQRAIGLIVVALWVVACSASVIDEPTYQKATTREIPAPLQPYVSIDAQAIFLENATVFTGENTAPLLNHSVLIEGKTITALGPHGTLSVPPGATRIDLAGKSLMPGIVGLHNHTHMPGMPLMSYTAPRLYLAAGVTTIQTAGSADPIGEIELARAIEAGEVPGPRIFPTGPYITGPGGNGSMTKTNSDIAARVFVNEWADKGAAWLKLYRHTDPEIAATIIEEAHRRGLKVTGHLCSITYAEAAAMGIDSLEHGLNPVSDFVTDKPHGECVPSKASKLDLDPDGPEIEALIEILVSNGVTITSTLAILESGYPHRPQADVRSLAALSPEWRDMYNVRQARLQASAESTSSTPEYWALLTAFEHRFVEAGGHLVAGPDTGRHVLPGYGDQRNFELLVESGFSVPQTIQTMSHNGAVTLGLGEQVGLIAPGYQADLVVIDGDLLIDPSNIRNAELIFKEGIGYNPEALTADVQGQVGLR